MLNNNKKIYYFSLNFFSKIYNIFQQLFKKSKHDKNNTKLCNMFLIKYT